MVCDGCYKGTRKVQFEKFNKIITSTEFEGIEKDLKNELISNFIIGLTINEINRSMRKNLMSTLKESFNKNLIKSLERCQIKNY